MKKVYVLALFDKSEKLKGITSFKSKRSAIKYANSFIEEQNEKFRILNNPDAISIWHLKKTNRIISLVHINPLKRKLLKPRINILRNAK